MAKKKSWVDHWQKRPHVVPIVGEVEIVSDTLIPSILEIPIIYPKGKNSPSLHKVGGFCKKKEKLPKDFKALISQNGN